MTPPAWPTIPSSLAEARRLVEAASREEDWKRWGPYLAERQWGTVREDYSEDGSAWTYFPHDHARSRAYRWGEDGLLGFCDRRSRLCFALGLWNERDPILKERLFGLSGPEGNHGEDVKEVYHYVDSTPTHSYMRALYRYPQTEFPYGWLVDENERRGRNSGEFELLDTGVFAENRYFDITAEYAKAAANDILIRIRVENRGPDAAPLHLLPMLWCRNTWSWGREGDGYWPEPSITAAGEARIAVDHASLGRFVLDVDRGSIGEDVDLIFADNETNALRLYGADTSADYPKDAFHDYVIEGQADAVRPERRGTKAAAHVRLEVGPGEERLLRLRLRPEEGASDEPFVDFDEVFQRRMDEADEFYVSRCPDGATEEEHNVIRQAYAGLLWCKQSYHYVVEEWLEGDPAQPEPPASRLGERNDKWTHLYNRDVLSMPDSWEYPWYAAWDLAFHAIPFSRIDPDFAKDQLVLLLREWYTHPDGQAPAYEWALGDVNPPVHAWACWRVYKMSGAPGERDRHFLARVFHKLLLNFTWWVNRKDPDGRNLFSGGFLGLDNIGVFDRSQPLPGGGHLEQADGTAWMAFYCATMLSIALELAREDPAYEDVASKFFEHFVGITDAINSVGGSGLWDDEDGFYYDVLRTPDGTIPLKVRSLVGLLPLIAAEVFEDETVQKMEGFKKRLNWFMENRPELAENITCMRPSTADDGHVHRLLAVPTLEQLKSILRYMLDEQEFLSPFGIRSLSRAHLDHPFELTLEGVTHRVSYNPGESTTSLFGGNSNWRGPVWFPTNFLLIEALERYHHFYGDDFTVEYPTGSGQQMHLGQVAQDLWKRLASLFLRDEHGNRPCHGGEELYRDDPAWSDLLLFHEHFHGDNGRGLGASHQTGWTALVTQALEDVIRTRDEGASEE